MRQARHPSCWECEAPGQTRGQEAEEAGFLRLNKAGASLPGLGAGRQASLSPSPADTHLLLKTPTQPVVDTHTPPTHCMSTHSPHLTPPAHPPTRLCEQELPLSPTLGEAQRLVWWLQPAGCKGNPAPNTPKSIPPSPQPTHAPPRAEHVLAACVSPLCPHGHARSEWWEHSPRPGEARTLPPQEPGQRGLCFHCSRPTAQGGFVPVPSGDRQARQ